MPAAPRASGGTRPLELKKRNRCVGLLRASYCMLRMSYSRLNAAFVVSFRNCFLNNVGLGGASVGRMTALAVRCATAALVVAFLVGFQLYPGNALRASAGAPGMGTQHQHDHDGDHNHNNGNTVLNPFSFFPWSFNGFNSFNNFGGCGSFSFYSCVGSGMGYPYSYAYGPTFVAPTYAAPQYAAPVTQVVGAGTTYVTPATTVQVVGQAGYATATPGDPVVVLTAGSSPQTLAPGCDEVHLDGGTGLTVKVVRQGFTGEQRQNISNVDSNGFGKFVYVNSGSSTPPTNLIGSGQLILIVCVVGFNTTISAPSASASSGS